MARMPSNGRRGARPLDLIADNAFAAALSAAVYTDNVWMLQTLDDAPEAMPMWRVAAQGAADPRQIERACLLKEGYKRMEGIDLPSVGSIEDPITKKRMQTSYQGGVFYAGELACAAVVERRLEGGKKCVELCFRGTEKETTGVDAEDRKNLIGGYFLSVYQNMDGHYERHRPLIDEVVREVNRRVAAGEDVELRVSGHSLGGAMAEIFAAKDAKRLSDPSRSTSITFGSPGMAPSSEPMGAFSMLVGGVARLMLAKLGLGTFNPRVASRNERLEREAAGAGEDLGAVRQFVDPNDPIPKIGLLGGLKPSGDVSYSRWNRDRDMKLGGVVEGSFLDVSWHSALLYEKSFLFRLDWCRKAMPQSLCERCDLGAFDRAAATAAKVVAGVNARLEEGSEMGHVRQAVDLVVAQARSSAGMIPKSAPNSHVDEMRREAGTQELGARLLSKLSKRRAKAEEISMVMGGIRLTPNP